MTPGSELCVKNWKDLVFSVEKKRMDLAGPSELGTLVSSVSDFFLSANLRDDVGAIFSHLCAFFNRLRCPLFSSSRGDDRAFEILLFFCFVLVLDLCSPIFRLARFVPSKKKTNSKNLNRVCTYRAYFLLNLSAEQKNTGIPILLKR